VLQTAASGAAEILANNLASLLEKNPFPIEENFEEASDGMLQDTHFMCENVNLEIHT
jgi:hypothetical protein